MSLLGCSTKESDHYPLIWMKINDSTISNIQGSFDFLDRENNIVSFGYENGQYSSYFVGEMVEQEELKGSEGWKYYIINGEKFIENGEEFEFKVDGFATVGEFDKEYQVMFMYSEDELVSLGYMK